MVLQRKRFALLKKTFTWVFDLVAPERCRVCGQATRIAGQEHGPLCEHCLAMVHYVADDWCLCGRTRFASTFRGHRCGQCLDKMPSYVQAMAPCLYEEPVNILLRRLKYGGDSTVLPALACIVRQASHWRPEIPPDCIIPVPLHRRRLKERGFNQSLVLARLLFPQYRSKIDLFALQRQKDTTPQAGLDRAARKRNLRHGFVVPDPKRVSQRRIYLVDDVFTTGATMEECAQTLVKAGALEVVAVSYARVPQYF